MIQKEVFLQIGNLEYVGFENKYHIDEIPVQHLQQIQRIFINFCCLFAVSHFSCALCICLLHFLQELRGLP